MPASPESYQQAQQYRQQQLSVRAAFLAQFVALWPLLYSGGGRRGHPTAKGIDNWLRLAMPLIRRWRGPSHELARQFYETVHLAEVGTPAGIPVGPPEIPNVQIIKDLVGRGPGTLKRARLVGLDDLAADERAMANAAGVAGRLVMGAGRDTVAQAVTKDRAALGWMRISDGDPCYWCAMLVSRGAVYKSAASAGGEQNSRFIGEGQFKYHDHCGCTAVPVFTRSEFMSPDAMRLRRLWDRTYGASGTTDAGNKVKGLAYFRAVLEGRAPHPES